MVVHKDKTNNDSQHAPYPTQNISIQPQPDKKYPKKKQSNNSQS
jgi:hypothetical protein